MKVICGVWGGISVLRDGSEEIIKGLVNVNWGELPVWPFTPRTLGFKGSETTTGKENVKFDVVFLTGGITFVGENRLDVEF